MNETPRILQTEAKHTAVIHLNLSMDEMKEQFGPAVGELIAGITAQGVSPVGAVFAHHLDLSRLPEFFDFELSVPVSAPITPVGRIKPSVWPSMRVAQTIYHGPYEGLGEAWGEFMGWIEANGHQPASELYECYLSGPECGPDSSKYRTELIRPLVG